MKDIFGQGGSQLFGRTMGRGADYSVRGFTAGVGCQQSSMAMVPLWTPDMISGATWVDADTVTLDGSAVAAMTDKVGWTIQATQGTSTARPTLVADALGTEDVVQFDGGDFLSFGTALGKPANWTIFVVGMFASQPAGAGYLCCSCNSSAKSATSWGGIAAGRTANDGKLEYQFGNGTNYSYGRSTNAVISNGNWFLVCRRYTSGQDRVVDRVNGVASAVTWDSGSATTTAGTAFGFSIGRLGEANLNYFPNGSQLKGFICVPTAISDSDAAKLEGYYAHSCGLALLLPSDHPYKSAAPTV